VWLLSAVLINLLQRRSKSVVEVDKIMVELVTSWDEGPIVDLYRAGDWWNELMDKTRIPDLISGSFLFAVAFNPAFGRTVGMGRTISDGLSDAYLQDLIVLPEWRHRGVGRRIATTLLEGCRSRGVKWIGLIAEPGTEAFYRSLGFEPMKGYAPMLFLDKN
jgi:ribosomal protein S18 acetylase RimI-like enzyme